MIENDFKEQLSNSRTDASWFDPFYHKLFKHIVGIWQPGQPISQYQALGIDRVIMLGSGRCIYVEEKLREKDYGDVLLEYESNDATHAPGWIEKDLQCDFLAYGIRPSKRCLFFYWPTLRKAWLDHREAWKSKYGTERAKNAGYYTLSVPIPVDVLQWIPFFTEVTHV